MADETTSATGIGGLIPHFFFDVIGRVVPGAYFLLGVCALTYPGPMRHFITEFLSAFPKDSIAGGSLLFIVFFAVAYFVGFYFGSLAHLFVEQLVWGHVAPWKISEIPECLGKPLAGKSEFEASFSGKQCVRIRLPKNEHEVVHQIAELCGQFLWAADPTIAVIGSRWDAEALASRSVLLASVVLLVWSYFVGHWVTFLFFGLVLPASLSAYSHHRRRRVGGKFSLYEALLFQQKRGG